jgi:hypothetical protein
VSHPPAVSAPPHSPPPQFEEPPRPPAPISAAPPTPVSAAPPTPVSAAPQSNGAAKTPSSPAPSREPLGARRAAGDDLIAELFERLHELVFANGVVAGAAFVLDVLLELIPSEYGIVQVFDLNSRKFVVVRARGPGLERALLEATPDTDPLLADLMRRPDAVQFDAAGDPRFAEGRWRKAASPPRRVLCGGVSQAGRYLGVIELGDPAGGQPFNDNERNALVYACEQFAEFVATHPVVIDRDVVLGG